MRIDNLEDFRILVADDDKNTVAKIRDILEENGCRNITCKSKILAVTELKDFDLVILDIVWRGNTKPKHQKNDYFGISAAKYLREISPNCKVILMSKYFYELDQLKEISQVCTDIFSSNGDATKIFRTILKASSEKEGESFSRSVLLAERILEEVDGDIENKPSLVGISNQVHADLLRSCKSIEENQNRENATLLKEFSDNIATSLTDSITTISTAFRELLQEIKLMANDPKIQMNFNAPVSGAAGNVEGNLLVNPPLKIPEEAVKKIHDLLAYLQKSNPTDIESAINQEIIRNPTFKSRLRNALKEAGLETAKIIFAPFGIGIEAFRGWHDAE